MVSEALAEAGKLLELKALPCNWPRDIHGRMADYLPTLSFLRELRIDIKNPAIEPGFLFSGYLLAHSWPGGHNAGPYAAMESAVNDVARPSKRKVGFLLGTLIVLFPLIFYWFLLRRGYSNLARVLGLLYMVLPAALLAALIFSNMPPKQDTAQSAARPPATSTENIGTASNGAGTADPTPVVEDVPADVIDKITLLYTNHNIYPGLAVECRHKMIEARNMVGCRGIKVGGQSNVQVWEFRDGQFWSINGSARGIAESKFANERLVRVSPLPLPADIDVDKVVKDF